MIQVLTYTGRDKGLKGKDIILNSLHDAKSLDEFDINIIDLSDKDMWVNNDNSKSSLNIINDLKSLSKMLGNSNKAKNIIFFPQNETFCYWYSFHDKAYSHFCELKDMIYELKDRILCKVFEPINSLDIIYENTSTKVGQNTLTAAFYFNNVSDTVLTKSVKSEKCTTIKISDTIISTLEIKEYEVLISFLKELKLLNDKQDLPEWVKEVKMFDDEKQFGIIEKNTETIRIANKNISEAMEKINKNNEYKSILYTSGDELVNVVFMILEEMLGCDLKEFQDKKKEDFNFKINDKIFVGEIKGVTPNVKKANVSQLDVHVQEYLDEHDEPEESIVALLVINHQRNKPFMDRESVHNDIIKLAERNGSLIVETISLLKLFEKYLSEEVTREECLDIFINNTGLLTI